MKRLLDQQAKISIITTTLKYYTKLKFLHFSGGLKNNKQSTGGGFHFLQKRYFQFQL
jgi:hypothetical protein